MLDRVGGIVGLIEEAEVHRLQQSLGAATKLWPGIPDHDEGGREPAIVDRRDQGADRLSVRRIYLQGSATCGIDTVEEKAVNSLHATQAFEYPADPVLGLGRPDDLELL